MTSRAAPSADAATAALPATPRSQIWIGAAGAALILLATATVWYVFATREAPPDVQLAAAFERLDRHDDPAAWEAARRLAENVRDASYRDPAFSGATEFILGVLATRSPKSDPDRPRQLALAVKLMRDAERQGLDESRRPEWASALGTSLFELGESTEARPLLEEAWITDPAGKVDSGFALIELELSPATVDSDRIDELLSALDARTDLGPVESRRLISLRARHALKTRQLDEAERSLKTLQPAVEANADQQAEISLLWAELSLAREQVDEARRRLMPLAFSTSIDHDPDHVAGAAYLLGVCEERRGDVASATRAFERAANVAPKSRDGTAAALAAARMLQQTARDEESLALFRQAIESQASVEPAPLRTDEFRSAIRSAWDRWIESRSFNTAIELADASEPVLGRVDSLDMQARGREHAAEELEAAWQAAFATRRAELSAERFERWRLSGIAYRTLAGAVTDTSRVSAALWSAADHFYKAHAFVDAEAVLSELVELRIPRLEATALVRRGQTRLDLGRPQQAAADFEAVLKNHPTDPKAFEARFLLGRCLVEAGDTAGAEAVWRELLALSELTPDAAEWRAALFALAELLYRRGTAAIAQAETDAMEVDTWGAQALLPLDEAISRFDEYLRRSPDAPDAAEARVLRSDAMRRRADLALRRAETAETENLRESDRREAERLLVAALTELRKAQDVLAPQADDDRLSPLGRELLRSTYFALAHTYAAMRRDREAVIAYGAAINRYPEDSRVVAAYLRMAECHRRLDRPEDARAASEQARLLLENLPDASLSKGSSALSRREWRHWIARLSDHDSSTAGP